MSLKNDQIKVVIIGAGIAGLTLGIRLKTKLNFDNFIIYEKAGDIGGTWRDNSYPGCQCDLPAHVYCLSTDLKSDWKSYYATQPDILQYWRYLASKYNLFPHIVFNTAVKAALWDADANEYHVTIEDTIKHEESEVVAQLVMSAIGYLSFPRMPKDIPGMETFSGPSFHSSQWQHDIDFKGKRVGVIGLGSSAAQIVPALSTDPTVQVVNFLRTPAWLFKPPVSDSAYSDFHKWLFAHVPGYNRIYRLFHMSLAEPLILTTSKDNKLILSLTRKIVASRIRKDAPKEYRDDLIPDYPFGCRRFVVDAKYTTSLHRPNVSIRKNDMESVVPEGIRTKSGDVVPLDVIVYATGFQAVKSIVDVKGRTGITINNFNERQGGPSAYMGMAVPEFPNYFTLLGPNSIAGHISNAFIIEREVDYILQLIRPVIRRKANSVEVTNAAYKNWNDWLDKNIKNSIYLDCHSYFRNNGTGKVDVVYPGSTLRLIWQTSSPRWSDFRLSGGEEWMRRRQRNTLLKALFGIFALIFAMGVASKSRTSWIWACLVSIQTKISSLRTSTK